MVDLKEDKIVCDKCRGTGRTEVRRNHLNYDYLTGTCHKCFGKGKLDWIENITGAKMKMHLFNWDILPRIKPEFLKGFLFKPLPRISKQEKQKNHSTSL